MKIIRLIVLALLIPLSASGQQSGSYRSLDPQNPIIFEGDHIIYKGETFRLGPGKFFIDGRLSDEEASKYPYVFNSINKAAEHLTDGTETSPMVLYIAPWVYWIDDPDDPAIRVGRNGESPYALTIDCEWLRFYGLSDKAENVVLACNRGQTIGSQGNFTLFRLIGDGTSSENITFGNYCNVDLEFPLKPDLGRKKRASAIVQAQLIYTNGDKIVARNTRFISRLNLMPFVGGRRVLFDRCHFECTDDAMCATGVYLNCTMDFYSSKPFYATTGTGSILLNCDIRIFTRGEQYFTKGGGQVTVIDTRFCSENANYIGWREIVPADARNYESNVSLNGKYFQIGKRDPASTLDISGKSVLNAYRFIRNGKVEYNIYNLLCGNDNWDPLGMRETVIMAEKENGKKYSMLPVQIVITPSLSAPGENNAAGTGGLTRSFGSGRKITIETGKDSVLLTAKVFRFGNSELKGEEITWSVSSGQQSLVKLNVRGDGSSCEVIPSNDNDEASEVIIKASSPSGLEAAALVSVLPSKLDPPEFIISPKISRPKYGKLFVEYSLDMKYDDQSLVTWYRCTNEYGADPVEVAVSRLNKPLLEYELSSGDIGYFIMASVAPKHLRCDAGKPVSFIRGKAVTGKDVKADKNVLHTDFRNIPAKNQPRILPGFWTMTPAPGPANDRVMNTGGDRDAWLFGEGSDGSAGLTGLLQSGRNARMLYTPVGNEFGDMKLSMTVVPSKTAGQGFSVAHLYMDVLIKFDTKTMSGYGLRFIRTTKYHDAVDCFFVKYNNGNVTEISKPVSTSCFRPSCNITVEVSANKIIAHADSPAEYFKVPGRPEVVTEVYMETEIIPGNYGGFGVEYTGGASTMIREMKVEWK